MRLIDADALLEEATELLNSCETLNILSEIPFVEGFINSINKAPTIEVGAAEAMAEVVNKIGEIILEAIQKIDWDEVLKYLEASKEEQPSHSEASDPDQMTFDDLQEDIND